MDIDVSNIIGNAQAQSQKQSAINDLGDLQSRFQGKNREEAAAAAEELEGLFISQMVAHMFNDLPTDGYFGGGNSEKIFREMMVDEYGKGLAKAGGIGLSDSIYTQILKMQEAE